MCKDDELTNCYHIAKRTWTNDERWFFKTCAVVGFSPIDFILFKQFLKVTISDRAVSSDSLAAGPTPESSLRNEKASSSLREKYNSYTLLDISRMVPN